MTDERDRLEKERPEPQRPGQEPEKPPGTGDDRDRDRPRPQRPGQEPEPPAGAADPRTGPQGAEEAPGRSGGEWRVRRILVALDASPASRAAATTAARLAAHLRAELAGLFVEDSRLVRLLPGAREVGSYSATARPLGDDEVRRRLRAQAARARRLFEDSAAGAAVQGTFRVVRGAVAREVAAATQEGELLSLGRVGTSGLSRLGSVARAALAQGRGPLLLLPPGGVVAPPVVAVYGGGAAGLRTLSAAARLCRSPALRRGVARIGPGAEPGRPEDRRSTGPQTAEEGTADERAARGWSPIPWEIRGAGPGAEATRRQAPRQLEGAPRQGPTSRDRREGDRAPSVLRPGRPAPSRPPELIVLLTPTEPAELAEHEEEARIFLRETGVVPRFLHPRPTPSDAGRRQLLDRHLLTRAVALERANVLVLPTDSPLAAPEEIETVAESLDCAVLLLR